jgi:SAM-dependent methyltransferase
LEEALRQGYRSVVGIEPSAAAVDRASPKIRRSIVCDVLRPGLLGQEQFDLICVFQVLDHVPDPAAFIDLCNGLLRPGGCLLVLNHNVESLSARLLCARSPIIDVQHTYLYSRATLAALCEGHGLVVRESANAWNCCSLDYLVHLLPIPELVKRRAKEFLRRSRLATATAWLPLGNLYAIAQKPSWRAL